MSAAGAAGGAGEEREGGHVSVTTIHMPGPAASNGQFSYSGSGVRISVPPDPLDEDSADAEVSSIDFHQYEVNLRHKKRLAAAAVAAAEAAGPVAAAVRERPMSWEGELSDSEMVIDTAHTNLSEEHNGLLPVKAEPGAPPPARQRARPATPPGAPGAPGRQPAPAPLLRGAASPAPAHSIKKEPLPELKCEPSLGTERLAGALAGSMAGSLAGSLGGSLHGSLGGSLHGSLGGSLHGSLGGSLHGSLHGSPLAGRLPRVHSSASTDSAVASLYNSVYSSPGASPLAGRAPRSGSLSRNNSDASHSSCYSYSSEFSPAHSPTQGRHGLVYRECGGGGGGAEDEEADGLHQHQGISRQQLINSPCPVCGDKISGFHYGIFSCESCKGFFKRTVQNRKNYLCLRGGACPVGVSTRKKCPACRFDKCLARGMKLEAIREDRTRGGRSTYQCSYAAGCGAALPPGAAGPAPRHAGAASLTHVNGPGLYNSRGETSNVRGTPEIPPLLQEIMDVEHLWQYNESELRGRGAGPPGGGGPAGGGPAGGGAPSNPLLAASGITAGSAPPDFLADLCHIADHRLYKIVKWCKSLPLFKNISIDDQICLLINSWCELLVLSCCYRGVVTPGSVRVGGITAHHDHKAGAGLGGCVERMLHFTEQLRRLRVDRYEYVALKVIVLLTSDAPELREAEKVRASQEKALAALQQYTAAHSPDAPAKFGELLLRIPELQRTCQFFMQVGKEMLSPVRREGDAPSFNLLMELLRGDH